MRVRLLFVLLASLLAAACTVQQGAAPSPTPSPLRNPLNVPLYPGSAIIAVHAFHQNVNAQQTAGTVFTGGSGAYEGVEVLASSGASLGALTAWVRHFGAYSASQTLRYGFAYSAFERVSGGKTHGMLAIVMDPQVVDRQFGSVLGMIANYRSLPPFMRAPIDAQVKQRLGITLSDAMQPESPIGATLAALNEFEQRNSRGIVLIDAVHR